MCGTCTRKSLLCLMPKFCRWVPLKGSLMVTIRDLYKGTIIM